MCKGSKDKIAIKKTVNNFMAIYAEMCFGKIQIFQSQLKVNAKCNIII